MTSALVPNFSAPLSRTETLASQRRWPFSISQVDTSMNCRACLTSVRYAYASSELAHVGLADDFDQRRAAAIEIDVGVAVGILEAFVLALAGVVFHVDAGDADAFGCAVDHDIDEAVLGERLIVLRNLVALGQVGIEIILAGETGDRIDAQFSAMAALMASSTASRLRTGSAPGNPRQTGQTLVFGGAPKPVGHPQKILVRVASWQCTSRPITGSYLGDEFGWS